MLMGVSAGWAGAQAKLWSPAASYFSGFVGLACVGASCQQGALSLHCILLCLDGIRVVP